MPRQLMPPRLLPQSLKSSSPLTKTGSSLNTIESLSGLPSVASLPSFPTLGSLTPQPPQAPRFPSFSELVSHPAPEQHARQSGLFASLVRDPAILYQEYLERPELFEEDTGHLLATLVGRSKKMEDLTDDELKQLDEAVVSYMQYQPSPEKKELLPPELGDLAEDDELDLAWGPNGPQLRDPDLFSQLPEDVAHRWWKEV